MDDSAADQRLPDRPPFAQPTDPDGIWSSHCGIDRSPDTGRTAISGWSGMTSHSRRFAVIPGQTGATGRSGADRPADGAEVLAADDDAGGHALLRLLDVDPRVVLLLGPDLAVDLQDAVVVGEHVAGDRPGVGVLRVGVDVHLDHAVVDRL